MTTPTREELRCLESAYIAMLQLPDGSIRLTNQLLLCGLRDVLATAVNRSKESVQNEYEARSAALLQAQGESEPIGEVKDNPDDIGTYVDLNTQLPIGTKLYTAPPSSNQVWNEATTSDETILSHMSKYWEHQWHDGDQHQIRISREQLVSGVRALLSQPAAAPEDFDRWSENPYTKVLQKSIAEDYVPKPAAAPVSAVPAKMEAAARQLYAKWTDEQGVHCNRFPSWDELPQKEQNKWLAKASPSNQSQGGDK
jgi:hypothetical protein